jgi:fatty acid desaturase
MEPAMAALAHSSPAADHEQICNHPNKLDPQVRDVAEADHRESQRLSSKLFAIAFVVAILGVTSLWVGFIFWILCIAVQSIF